METNFFNRAEKPQPDIMTVFAQAVWSDEKKGWIVDIIQTSSYNTSAEHYITRQQKDSVFVEDCDELVIADALLFANGIEVQELDYTDRDDVIIRGL
jgi:hypothetical protein